MFSRKQNCRFTSHRIVSLRRLVIATFTELIEFTTRQIKITRVYASHLWLPLLLGSVLFTLVFFGGLVLIGVYPRSPAVYVFPLIFSRSALPNLSSEFVRFPVVSEHHAAISWRTSFSGRSRLCSIFTTPSSRVSRGASVAGNYLRIEITQRSCHYLPQVLMTSKAVQLVQLLRSSKREKRLGTVIFRHFTLQRVLPDVLLSRGVEPAGRPDVCANRESLPYDAADH